MTHLTFEQLSDRADGNAPEDRSGDAAGHLAECAECRAQVERLKRLAETARTLPESIAPPVDLWNDVRVSLAPRAVVQTGRSQQVRMLLAASIVTAIASSLLTATFLSHRDKPPVVAERLPSELPAQLASTESGYARSAAMLERTLAERRDSLAPSTVATVERSLRVADSAIAEAREALAHDPGNQALAFIYSSNYERKLDLLRRATELAPRT